MTQIKYITTEWEPTKISPLEVIRETELSFVVAVPKSVKSSGEQRIAKSSRVEKCHDTWEEAREHLLDKARRRIEALALQLYMEKSELAQIEDMKP